MRFLLLTLSLAAVVTACKSPKNTAENPLSSKTVMRDTVVIYVAQEPADPRDTLLIAFEKTPCFGRCPVYKVKIFESGFAIYEGINFAEKMGLYSTQFSKEKIDKMYEAAHEIGFFELNTAYDNPRITDLPSTITMFHREGVSHRIKSRSGVPEKLVVLQDSLTEMIEEMPWQPYKNR